MRRPMVVLATFYVVGIVSQYFLNSTLWLIPIIALLLLWLKGQIHDKKYWLYGLLVLLLIYVGGMSFKIQNDYQGNLKPLLDEEVTVVGDVLQTVYKDNLELTLAVKEISFDEKVFSSQEKVVVKLYGEKKLPQNLFGKRVKIRGTLREVQGPRNPKTFDYKTYLKTKEIYSILYSTTDRLEILGEGSVPLILKMAQTVKNKMIEIVAQTMPEKEGGLLLGILIGDKERLDLETYDEFRKVGIAHVLSVSGFNVGILYMVLNRLLNKISINLRIPIMLVVLWFYAVVTGFSPSIVRATAMAMILILAPIFNRKYDSLSAIYGVLFFVLVLNPLMLMDIGFQLSFVAVLSIALFYKPLCDRLAFLPEFWAQLIAVSLAAQIGANPVTAYHFNQVSVIALIVNIPIVLLVGYITPLGLVALAVGLISIKIAMLVNGVNLILIRIMIWISHFAESIPFSSLQVISPSYLFIAVYYGIFVLWAMKVRELEKYKIDKKKSMLFLIFLYLFMTIGYRVLPKEMEITFVDVGQGDCILIRTPRGKNILVDAGGNNNPVLQKRNVGKEIVIPYLLKNGISKIDLAISSHVHSDHIGGFVDLFKEFKIQGLMIGTDVYETEEWKLVKTECKAKKIKIYQVFQGDRIHVEDGLILDILHPGKALIESGRDDANNNSLVVLLHYQDMKILLTGDIEKEAEEALIKNYPDLDIDVLKVAHHGSVYSSTDGFIQGLKPEIAVIQVGKNSFGHPHPQVLDKLCDQGISVYRTDQQGAIIMKFSKKGIKVHRMLEEN